MLVSGISSGIDTVAIIEQIVAARRKPVEALQRRQDALLLRRQIYADLTAQLRELQNRLFTLRLQSTFQSKKVTSSAPTKLTATAQTTAPAGTHLIEIAQLARPARVTSQYARAWLVPSPANTAGLSAVSGRPANNLGGVYDLTVAAPTAYRVTGAVAEDDLANNPPTVAAGFTNSGADKIRITVNGITQDVLVTSWAAGDTMEAVAAQLQADINAAFGDTVVSVNASALSGASNDRFTIIDALAGRANTVEIDYVASSSLGGGPALTALGLADASGAAPHPDVTSALGSDAVAAAAFSLRDGRTMPFLRAAQTLESASVEGALATSLTGAETLAVVLANGTQVSVTLPSAAADLTSVHAFARQLEALLNDALNDLRHTTGKAYLAVSVERSPGTAGDRLAIYDVASVGAGQVSIDYQASSGAAALGFVDGSDTAGRSATLPNSVVDLTQPGVASTLPGLFTRLNDPLEGLLAGVTFTAQATGLQAGTARLLTDATVAPGIASPARVYGAPASDGDGLALYLQGLPNAGFANAPSQQTNGTFSINGVRITIADYQSVSVAQVLGLINGSNAGVTATHDSANDRFVLTANQNGPSTITLGSAYDTSNFLTVAKLTVLEGAQTVHGASAGTASATQPLSQAGLGLPPTSGTFTVNGVTIYLDVGSDSLSDLADMITASGAGVVALYDQQADTFVITSDPNAPGSNENRILLGSPQDTSNILQALNLLGSVPAQATGQALSGLRAAQTVVIQSAAYGTRSVSIQAVTADGAFQTQAAGVGIIDIAPGASFDVTTNLGAVQWTNNSGQTIRDFQTWLREWNDPSNWNTASGPTVRVKAVSEGPGLIRYFAADGGDATTFSISPGAGTEPGDALEVGMPQAPADITVAGAGPSTQYNALNFAWDLQEYPRTTAETGLRAYTDGAGAITLQTTLSGVAARLTISDSGGSLVTEFFGVNPLTMGPAASETGEAGQEALFTLDGTPYSRRSNTVTDAASGMTLSFLATTDQPVTLDVAVDAEPALRALARWVSAWNQAVDTLNPDLLTPDQRQYLEPLTDERRRTMTAAEIDAYLANYREYNAREVLRVDSSLQRLYQQMRARVVAALQGAALTTLASLGLSTVTSRGLAGKGRLVADTTDEDALYQRLADNTTLLRTLTTRSHAVYEFFAQAGYQGSGASIASAPVINLITGVNLPAAGGNVVFRVGDGQELSAQAVLSAGRTYTPAQILTALDQAGLNVGAADEHQDRVAVVAAVSLSGALVLTMRNDAEAGQQVYLYDESQGTNNLTTVLGFDLTSDSPGLARVLDSLLDSFTSATGVLPRQYLPGGVVDREWRQLQTHVERMEDRIEREEALLTQRFIDMEQAIAEAQWQSQFLTSQIASLLSPTTRR